MLECIENKIWEGPGTNWVEFLEQGASNLKLGQRGVTMKLVTIMVLFECGEKVPETNSGSEKQKRPEMKMSFFCWQTF